jgi:hypothetical protein
MRLCPPSQDLLRELREFESTLAGSELEPWEEEEDYGDDDDFHHIVQWLEVGLSLGVW